VGGGGWRWSRPDGGLLRLLGAAAQKLLSIYSQPERHKRSSGQASIVQPSSQQRSHAKMQDINTYIN